MLARTGLGSRIEHGFSESVSALTRSGRGVVIGTALLPWVLQIVPGFLIGGRAHRRYAKPLPTAKTVNASS
ncbi:MAG: hypothetical protein ACKV2T_40570 [Kofleriaceae bacterium]